MPLVVGLLPLLVALFFCCCMRFCFISSIIKGPCRSFATMFSFFSFFFTSFFLLLFPLAALFSHASSSGLLLVLLVDFSFSCSFILVVFFCLLLLLLLLLHLSFFFFCSAACAASSSSFASSAFLCHCGPKYSHGALKTTSWRVPVGCLLLLLFFLLHARWLLLLLPLPLPFPLLLPHLLFDAVMPTSCMLLSLPETFQKGVFWNCMKTRWKNYLATSEKIGGSPPRFIPSQPHQFFPLSCPSEVLLALLVAHLDLPCHHQGALQLCAITTNQAPK